MISLTSFTWINAGTRALLSSSTLLLGAFLATLDRFDHRGVSRFMAIGSGSLLGLLAFDMTLVAMKEAGSIIAGTGLPLGAICFWSGNWLLANKGARHRKRCGNCVEQPSEGKVTGSGAAIAAGTLMDSIPEELAIG